MSVIIWPFSFLMRGSKNGSSLKPCSMVNFSLGCWFWSKLCKLLMFPHGHFQNMKQLSKYIFHDLINSVFILYFLPMISYRFSYRDRESERCNNCCGLGYSFNIYKKTTNCWKY